MHQEPSIHQEYSKPNRKDKNLRFNHSRSHQSCWFKMTIIVQIDGSTVEHRPIIIVKERTMPEKIRVMTMTFRTIDDLGFECIIIFANFFIFQTC